MSSRISLKLCLLFLPFLFSFVVYSMFDFLLFNFVPQILSNDDIHSIVLSYLVHNCFGETVESFSSCTGMKLPHNCLEDMEKRKRKHNLFTDVSSAENFGSPLLLNSFYEHLLM